MVAQKDVGHSDVTRECPGTGWIRKDRKPRGHGWCTCTQLPRLLFVAEAIVEVLGYWLCS